MIATGMNARSVRLRLRTVAQRKNLSCLQSAVSIHGETKMKSRYLTLVTTMGFAVFLSGACVTATFASMGAAEDFAVLGGSAVTCTGSAIEGDVGADPGGPVTQTGCVVSGSVQPGSLVAHQAYGDFLLASAALGAVPCDVNLTGQPLIGQSLAPGVYCFDVAVTETGGVLTLVGLPTDTWIFKIGASGTGALTGTNFSVNMPGGKLCNDNVFWLTADAATLTDSVFVGSILSGAEITVTRGRLDGQALAKGGVTLTGTSVCGPSPSIS
jgi:hypothetical protein